VLGGSTVWNSAALVHRVGFVVAHFRAVTLVLKECGLITIILNQE